MNEDLNVSPPKTNSYELNKEVDTGKTWINGKPIYRKVFLSKTPKTADGTQYVLATLPNETDTIIFLDAWAYFTSGWRSSLSWYSGSAYGAINASRTTIKAWTNYDKGTLNKDCYVIVEYTKTTDSATN